MSRVRIGYGENIMSLLSGDTSEGNGLHRGDNSVWLVEDFGYVFITVVSPMIILQSEKHFSHTLHLCTLPNCYD